MKPLTDAQRRGLKEIDAGRVVWDRFDGRYRSTAWPPAVRRDTIEALLERELAERGLPRGMGFVDVVLTDSGHVALREARG